MQSFLLVTLPVTSTSMRYDRYDTCLYVRARGPPRHTRKCLSNGTDEPFANRPVQISARRAVTRAGIIFHVSRMYVATREIAYGARIAARFIVDIFLFIIA